MFKAVQSLSLAMENRPPEMVTVAPQLECYTLRTVNIPGIGTFGTITGVFGEFIVPMGSLGVLISIGYFGVFIVSLGALGVLISIG